MEEPQKEIIIVKQKSGCLAKLVLMLVALLLIIILFPALCGIGILGGLVGLAGVGGLCAITQPTIKENIKDSKQDNKKEIRITTKPSETIITPKNIIQVQGIPQGSSKTIKTTVKIMVINDDFSIVLEDEKIIIFDNVVWEDDKKEEIMNFLNEYKNKKVRTYFITERTSSMGDYKLEQDNRGYYLIKDIRDNNNNSVLEELKKRNLIKNMGK